MKQTFFVTRLNKFSIRVFSVSDQISFTVGQFNPHSLFEVKMSSMFEGTICKFVVYPSGSINMTIIK